MDGDAALALLTEAERLGRTEPEALPRLEEAVALFQQGTFLQDEEGQWAAGRRATVEQTRYRSRLWLAEAYEQQDLPGQAETILSALLEDDPTDEDALRRLMLLLHQQGMTHQALRLYQRTNEACMQEMLGLTEATKTLAHRLREAPSAPFGPLILVQDGENADAHIHEATKDVRALTVQQQKSAASALLSVGEMRGTTVAQRPQDTTGWPASLTTWPLDVPLARITTCGCSPVSLEVLQGFEHSTDAARETLRPIYAPPAEQQGKANGGRTALVLLEVLTSQPGLVASQDLLAQALRPARQSVSASSEEGDEDESLEDRALKRPENVVTLLRRLLFPPALAHLPQADQRTLRNALIARVKASTDSGPAYRLAGLPLLWIDVDVMEAHYQRIPILTQFGEDALDAWQAICELGLRGQFLPHERYSDWVRWRRGRVREVLWQSIDAQLPRVLSVGGSGGGRRDVAPLIAPVLARTADQRRRLPAPG